MTDHLVARRIVQRASAAAGAREPTPHDVATATIEAKGSGAPVPDAVRRTAESHLGGADLRDVRVHTDATSRAGAEMIGAQAFAYGSDVFLGPGQSPHDVGLMTHELTHVVQQGAAGPAVQRKVEVAPSDHPAEAEADAVASKAVAQGEKGGSAIVEDGADAKPGQMTRSALIAQVSAAAQREITSAPPAMQAGLRRDVEAQIATYRAQDLRTLNAALASAAGPKADAQQCVAVVTAKIHEQVAAVVSGGKAPAPATGAEAAAQMGPSHALDGAAAKLAGDVLGEPVDGVKVHTGPEAARFASEHGARAVAVGDHIAFGAGQYQPNTPAGDALLAHEVAHVAQMRGADPDAPLDHGPEDHADELEADEVAAHAVATAHAPKDASAARKVHKKSIVSRMRSSLQLKRCDDNPQQAPLINPYQAQANVLAGQLQTEIDGAVWREIRKRAYPAASAAGIVRAKQRQQGARPDLTGLGSIVRLDHFAAAIHQLQLHWPATEDLRLAAIEAAIGAEMDAVAVPRFDVVAEPMEFKGSFGGYNWTYNVSEELVQGGALSDADAAELCNTTAHEARHAEQEFLAARYAASAAGGNKSAATIAAENRIPLNIAQQARAARFTGATPAAVQALGQTMYQANVTDRAQNQHISDDDYLPEMAVARAAAQQSLDNLRAAPSQATITDAGQKRATLAAAVAEVERRYLLYRAIPYEADAHEVGDAAEEAFKGWP